TTFRVQLPVEVPDMRGPVTTQVALQKITASAQATGLQKVLVIDDDPMALELMNRLLAKEGFRVYTAQSGEDGLRLAKEQLPDVITVDVMMPGRDGWAVLARLKQDEDLAQIPVIMITMVDNEHLGHALGAADYLTKPVEKDRLLAIVNKYRCKKPPCPVLVVEDDLSTRDMMSRTLRQQGWKVSEADNGRIALQRLEENKPELILLDLMMPEMDGFEFVQEVRKKEDWRNIPIVVVTAKEITTEDRLRLDGYVRKIIQKGSYSRDQLVNEIRSVIQM